MVDADTPDSAKTRTGFDGNSDWELVFSDEFNKDGRTFFDGGKSVRGVRGAEGFEGPKVPKTPSVFDGLSTDVQMMLSGLEWVSSSSRISRGIIPHTPYLLPLHFAFLAKMLYVLRPEIPWSYSDP